DSCAQVADPASAVQRAYRCQAWPASHQEGEGVALMHPRKDPSRRCLLINQWPAADLQLWQDARRQGDILEGGGRAAHWAAHTVLKIQKGYGRWLTWHSANGYLAASATPSARVTRANVAAYVASLQALNAPYTVL